MNPSSAASSQDGKPSPQRCHDYQEVGRCLTPHVVAIDGPAGSGKSTVGFAVAQALDYLYFDTGAMYRAVTWTAIARGIATQDEHAIGALASGLDMDIRPPADGPGSERNSVVIVDGEEITHQIRRPEVDQQVSMVSAYMQVREAMSRQQRRIGQRYGSGQAEKAGVVMVGRDIGTVIMPEAPIKIYLNASTEERARRRHHELEERGKSIAYEQVLSDLIHRDRIDSSRALSPLRAAEDAVVLDTSGMSVDEAVAAALHLIEQVACGQTGDGNGRD